MKRAMGAVLFEGLLMGIPVKIGDNVYQFDETYNLCQVGLNVTTGEQVLLKVDLGLNPIASVIMLAGSMRDEDYERLIVNIDLNIKLG